MRCEVCEAVLLTICVKLRFVHECMYVCRRLMPSMIMSFSTNPVYLLQMLV